MRRLPAVLVLVLGVLAGCDLVFPPGSGPSGVADAPPGGDDAPPPSDGGDSPDAGGPPSDASYACPSSYVQVGALTSRYHLYQSSLGWAEAAGQCRNDQAIVPASSQAQIHLVVLDNLVEQATLFSMWFDSSMWIGLSDRREEGTFKTVSTQEPVYPPDTGGPWALGQPDNGGAGQDCVRILPAGTPDQGQLDDDDCDGIQYDFICECDAYADDPSKY